MTTNTEAIPSTLLDYIEETLDRALYLAGNANDDPVADATAAAILRLRLVRKEARS